MCSIILCLFPDYQMKQILVGPFSSPQSLVSTGVHQLDHLPDRTQNFWFLLNHAAFGVAFFASPTSVLASARGTTLRHVFPIEFSLTAQTHLLYTFILYMLVWLSSSPKHVLCLKLCRLINSQGRFLLSIPVRGHGSMRSNSSIFSPLPPFPTAHL